MMLRATCLRLVLAFALGAFTLFREAGSVEPNPALETARMAAKLQFDQGNFRDALNAYLVLARDPANQGHGLAADWSMIGQCLQRLRRLHEIDGLREELLQKHPQDWRFLVAAAQSLLQYDHWGSLVAGEFLRANQRDRGQWVDATERDRVRALQLLELARDAMPDDTSGTDRAEYFNQLAGAIAFSREWPGAWRLQVLTDTQKLPEYATEQSPWGWRGGSSAQGAPVDAEGHPVLYDIPASWQASRSDGERWRWCLDQMAQANSDRRSEATYTYANFLHQQFGVQTMAQWGIVLPRGDDADKPNQAANPFSLPSLQENETIARLATGIQRFALPDEHNPIRLFQTVSNSQDRHFAELATDALAQVFEDRQQYGKAAESWKSGIERFGPGAQRFRQARLDQIVKPWARFEAVQSQPAGLGATVEFRFRNGRRLDLTAYAIRVDRLIEDVKAYLKSDPRNVNWREVDIDNIGYRLVQEDEKKYLGDKVAAWSVDLAPRPNHADRRTTLTTPLQKAGAYLVVAKLADGNTSRIVLWVNDLALLKKQLDGHWLYYVADAVTGAPVAGAHLEFFGWKNNWVESEKRNHILTARFAELSTKDGLVETDPQFANPEYQWLAIARTSDGRTAHLGFSGLWQAPYDRQQLDQFKVYAITDRPVYRPDQKVQFKFWVRQTRYDDQGPPPMAGQSFTVKVFDPQGTEVHKMQLVADAFAGFEGEYALPDEAPLGVYQLTVVDHPSVAGGTSFRVEEYKKPEFEVEIEAPGEPVALGDKVMSLIRARYYFGEPVTNAKVKFKVERTSYAERWFPPMPWDWLYEPGYWWFAADSDWYPGFAHWGCRRPVPPWWHVRQDPPELVLEEVVDIGQDGTVKVEFDTALAKALHGDQDHRYTITAEVVDASRRTIVGTGSVLVARQPFQVFCWADRGYYRVGDPMNFEFAARTLDGKGVPGKGTLQLLKVRYDDQGTPEETAVQSWDLTLDADGRASQRMTASQAGQYRVSLKVDDGKGHVLEGGQLVTVIGEGFDSSQFRFNDLELMIDRREYQPGDKVQLLINTNRVGSTVLLGLRPVNGVLPAPPQVLRLDGKSTTAEIPVSMADMPNFFVEATTISSGRVHTVVREVFVPPVDRALKVAVEPSAQRYLPGQEATVRIRLTDLTGQPFVGSCVMSVYDRAVEYISGGSNVPEIRAFFWKWRRSHQPSGENSLERWFQNLIRQGEVPMSDIGVFGALVADGENRGRSGAGGFGEELRDGVSFRGGGRMALGAPLAAAEGKVMARDALAEPAAAPGSTDQAAAPGAAAAAPAAIRSEFADTAYWNAHITTDANGTAEVTFAMPENLTGWKIRTWALGDRTQVGEATQEVVTAKNIVVRLQAPRFFVEKDEIVLSAVVHNYLADKKSARVSLDLGGKTLEALESLEQFVEIPAGGETRVNWRVKAIAEGTAILTMQALTDTESDAMRVTLPVYVHGMLKTESFSGVIRPEGDKASITLSVPNERRPEQSRLEVRYSPTLAGAMVDALPYLVDYPYGCTEQTLNRFLPTVLTHNILKSMNLDLQAIRQKRTNLNSQEIGDAAERATGWKRWERNPVFDSAEVERMVKKGVNDLAAMQLSDGGWGWFGGHGEHSWPHTTAVVVHGLQVAQGNNVPLLPGVLENGIQWLKRYQDEQVRLLQEGERILALSPEQRPDNVRYRAAADNLDALVYRILVDASIRDAKMSDFLFRDRTKLSLYGLGLFGLALDKQEDAARRDVVIRNIDQYVVVDEENQTAYIDMPDHGAYWWYWYGDTIEANAHYLQLLTRANPRDPKAAGLVKYLLNNRKHATYWNSTRDTAVCIEALAEYLQKSGENKPDMTVEVWIDGERRKSVRITPEDLFTFDNAFVLEGQDLSAGSHQVELRRQGQGPVYFNAYLTNFTLEDPITAAGLEVKVRRKVYKLVERANASESVAGSRGQVVDQSVTKFDRVELPNLAQVESGQLVEVELEIESKNDYEYVVIDDMKAAGCEPVEVQSGFLPGSLGAYAEYRDERAAFFLRQLPRGRHSLSYRLRAEIPGTFSALPTRAWAMYAPELRGNSDEWKLRIEDQPE